MDRIIGISSVPAYNEQLKEKGIRRIVHKDFAHIDIFAKKCDPTSERINKSSIM